MSVSETIESWTQGEREQALSELLVWRGGGAVKLPTTPREPDAWCVSLGADAVPAGGVATAQCAPQMDFQPRRLIILEPTAPTVIAPSYVSPGAVHTFRSFWWWRTKTIKHPDITMPAQTALRPVPRGVWRVTGLFVGQKLQFPSEADIPGDAFSPDGVLELRDMCPAPMFITVQVRNLATYPLPFRAVIIGTDASARSLKAV